MPVELPRLLRRRPPRPDTPPPAPQGLTEYGSRWLTNPDGGGRFPEQRDAVLAHDQKCPSLADVWLPRKGGVSCPSDLMGCETCGITFFWEGLRAGFEDCPYSNHWYCVCCLAKATACPCGQSDPGERA